MTIGLAAALLVRGQPRATLGVRIHSGPSTGIGPAALRVSCIRRDVGIEDHVRRPDLVLILDGARRSLGCDEDGSAELAWERHAKPPILRLLDGEVELGQGRIDVGAAAWSAGHAYTPARLAVSGPVRGALVIPGGVLPTDAATELTFEPATDGAVTVSAAGGEVHDVAGGPERTRFVLVPRFLRVELSFERGAERSSLDVLASPLEARVEHVELRGHDVTAQLRRRGGGDRLHVVLSDMSARRRAEPVALTKDASGDGVGAVTLSLAGVQPPAWLEVSTSPDAPSALGVPLHPALDPRGRTTRDVLALSSVEALAARDGARSARALRGALSLILVGTVTEILLVLRSLRRARARLVEHLDAEGGPPTISRSVGWDVAAIVAVVAFGFAVIAAVFAWRA